MVFEHNKPKEEVKKEMEEIFQESADYIMDLLISLLEKYYGGAKDDNSNDLINEIYEDKPSGSKSLSSQVEKPTPLQAEKGSKGNYNQAISNVKDGERKNQSQNPRNKFDNNNNNQNYHNDRRYNNNNNNYNDRNNYYNGNRRNQSQEYKRGPYDNNYNNQGNSNFDRNSREENINVGGRNLVIKKRRESKNSRSRSRSLERERSKEKERNNNNNESNFISNNNNSGMMNEKDNYQQGFQQQHFNSNYHQGYPNDPRRQYVNSNYFQPGRGPAFQPRRLGLFASRGRFPGRFMDQRFIDPMNMGRYLFLLNLFDLIKVDDGFFILIIELNFPSNG